MAPNSATPRSWWTTSTRYHQGHRLAGAPHNDPFRLRVVQRATLGRSGIQNLPIDELRAHIGADLAADIRALLAGGRNVRR